MASISSTRHKEILNAATELFYARSFAAVGIDAIGERAGVTGPAVYRHFTGKNEILATLFDEAIDALVVATGQYFDDAWEELEYLVRGHARFVLDQRKLAGVKIREERSLTGPAKVRLRLRERRYIERWTTCLQRCLPDVGEDVLATITHASIGTLNSVASWPPEAMKADDVPGVMVSLVLGGLDHFRTSSVEGTRSA
jgi:AcrR family transcriptional regulator